MRGLRYAVSFDDEVPQILDMDRASGSGSIWDRSVVRGHIDYTTSHALASAGTHTLKIWMVDPGVVLDRIEIETESLPYTYRGAPETAVENFGSYRIDSGATVVLPTNHNFVCDSLTNNSTLALLGDARLDIAGGGFVNNGVLDLITWTGSLPPGFVNHGSILDALWIQDAVPSGTTFDVEIPGYPGHRYQLQKIVDGNLVSGGWSDVGEPVFGEGGLITFHPDLVLDGQGFYRVKVSP